MGVISLQEGNATNAIDYILDTIRKNFHQKYLFSGPYSEITQQR